ncbi:RAD9, HUS1, RAD1-interacting nuclear orphan protein 1 [Echinops telfairi]|uniref:RAD9, HUS1, RAD1-interacting nuclear orphan protein 1 n=1 Tax=Echinops telfairi TaxID=9371 RepID=A0ABM0IY83_ECHTE|nr:RAD9, HUS1, RAD1-interacting nuclear orphan protein 1 [Echinops telfairi]
MPPRKKRGQSCQKSPLLFHQQPVEGPKHHHGLPQLPVTNPRRVPSKPIDQRTIASWVLPQFGMTTENGFHVHRKRQRREQKRRPSRKSTTSKFPHLTFESPPSSSSSEAPGVPLARECPCPPEQDISTRPLVPLLSPQSCEDLSLQTLQSPGYAFIPPDIHTPEPAKEEAIPSNQGGNRHPGYSLRTSTPKHPKPGPILVKDTPEDKYGIKVTWRRRQHLLACLRESGKLSRSQFLVNN